MTGTLHDAARVDFGAAKASCKHCFGRGYTGWVPLPGGGRARLLCRCVVRNGGVPPAPAPVASPIPQKQTTAEEQVAERIRTLSTAQRQRTIDNLTAAARDASAPPLHRARLRTVLSMLEEQL